MVGVGRDLCGSSSPTLLPKQVGCRGPCPGGSWISPEKETPQPPWQPVPGLRHPQREEVLPHVQVELPVLQFVPVAPCPVAGHLWKESGPILLTPTLEVFLSIYEVASQCSLLQAEQAQLPQPFLIGEMPQSPHHHISFIFPDAKSLPPPRPSDLLPGIPRSWATRPVARWREWLQLAFASAGTALRASCRGVA